MVRLRTREPADQGPVVPLRGRDGQPRGGPRTERVDPEPRGVPARSPRRHRRPGQHVRSRIRLRLPGLPTARAIHHDLAGADGWWHQLPLRARQPALRMACQHDRRGACRGDPVGDRGDALPVRLGRAVLLRGGSRAVQPVGRSQGRPDLARARAQLPAEQATGARSDRLPEHPEHGIPGGLRGRRRVRQHLPQGRRIGRCDLRHVRPRALQHLPRRSGVALLREARHHEPRLHAVHGHGRSDRRLVHQDRRVAHGLVRDRVGGHRGRRSTCPVAAHRPGGEHSHTGARGPHMDGERRRGRDPQLRGLPRRALCGDDHHDGVLRPVGDLGGDVHVRGVGLRHRRQSVADIRRR